MLFVSIDKKLCAGSAAQGGSVYNQCDACKALRGHRAKMGQEESDRSEGRLQRMNGCRIAGMAGVRLLWKGGGWGQVET